MKSTINLFKLLFLILFFIPNIAFPNTLNKIEIIGNDRISDATIKIFIDVEINDEINNDKLNSILKDLYETNFFEDVRNGYKELADARAEVEILDASQSVELISEQTKSLVKRLF